MTDGVCAGSRDLFWFDGTAAGIQSIRVDAEAGADLDFAVYLRGPGSLEPIAVPIGAATASGTVETIGLPTIAGAPFVVAVSASSASAGLPSIAYTVALGGFTSAPTCGDDFGYDTLLGDPVDARAHADTLPGLPLGLTAA